MSTATKSILVVCEDSALNEKVVSTLKPLMKSVLGVSNGNDALKKMEFQEFDLIFYRTKTPSLANPKALFQQCLINKNFKKIPWVVLGKDIEDEQIVINHSHVKFLSEADDSSAILKIVNGIFFSTGDGNSKVDVAFMNPIISAVVEVIKSMGSIELKRGTPALKKKTDPTTAMGDVSGVIAMNSDRFVGSIAICFQDTLALKIYENMLGTKITEINDDVKDAVSEMTNIIFGNAKRDLNAAGHTITPAIPSVVSGKNHEIHHSVSGACFTIPFESNEGKCVVECVISMKNG